MRYLLASRFRGALLGGFLGETLTSSCQPTQLLDTHFAQSVIPGATSLIKLGKFEVDDWLEAYQQRFTDLEPITIIAATIPIALFYHENPVKLHQNLLQLLKHWDGDLAIRDSILAIGYAIAQSLAEQLHPQSIIPQITAFIGETDTQLPQNLLKVHHLLTQKPGLERVLDELGKKNHLCEEIALAFYYFLSTWEDFRLSVLRATHQHKIAPQRSSHLNCQTISIITAVLSGVHNSTASIPINWRVAVSSAHTTTSNLSEISQMLELADALATAWSGVYSLSYTSHGLPAEENAINHQQLPPCVYAAPRVMKK